jgi:pimeloyl-ACP methyl ester carboxylesterase
VAPESVAVVFVHGLFSKPATWSRFDQLIATDPDLAALHRLMFRYATPVVNVHPLRRIPNFNDIADNLRTFLDTDAAGHTGLILVSHSQGGLAVQRYLARMLANGRGRQLARIRRVVMFACPNSGSEVFLLLRRRWRWWQHPQERELRPINESIVDAQQLVLNQIVHAREIGPDRCPIPFMAYAGERDGIVTPASAKSVFPDTGVLPGDHFTIIEPDSHRHRAYTALKPHLLAALSPPVAPVPPPPTPDQPPPPTAPDQPPQPAPDQPPPTAPDQPPPSPDRPPPDGPLSIEDRAVIVDKLLAVPRMSEPVFRQRVYDDLPAVIVHQLARDTSARLELFGLLRTFGDFPHLHPWRALVDALRALLPHSPAVAELAATLAGYGLLTPPSTED